MFGTALKRIISIIVLTFRRFPIPVLFSLIYCILTIRGLANEERLIRYQMILYCGSFLFISLKLLVESHKWKTLYVYIVGFPLFFLLAGYFYTVTNLQLSFQFLGMGLFSSIFIIPFLNPRTSNLHFWRFNYRFWMHILFTILVAVILYCGVSAIIASLTYLFSIQFYRGIYNDLGVLIVTFFSPVLAMTGIPKSFDRIEENYPKIFQFLLVYILLPLLFVYAMILYADAVKILIEWNLPKGGVSYLVSIFGGVGVIVYLIGIPLHSQQKIINLFYRYFFKILLVPLILFALAIGVRIREYGITEDRYAVLLCLVWFSLSIPLSFLKYKESLPKFIMISFTVSLILASFGPWSAISLSTWSQLQRLKSLLKANQILIEGHIQPSPRPVSLTDQTRIISILDYFVHTKKIESIKPWFHSLSDAEVNKNTKLYSAEKIAQDIGIKYTKNSYWNQQKDHIYFNFVRNKKASIDIQGYEGLVNIGEFHVKNAISTRGGKKNSEKNIVKKEFTLTGNSLSERFFIVFSPEKNLYSVKFPDSGEELLFPLTDLRDVLRQAGEADRSNHKESLQTPIMMEQDSGNINIRLLIMGVDGSFNKKTKKLTFYYLDTILLIRRQKNQP